MASGRSRLAVAMVASAGLIGCGRAHFDPISSDADSIADAPPCQLGAFGPPSVLPGPVNSSLDDWTPAISASDLTLLFYSLRPSAPGSPDIWSATRAAPSAPWQAPTVITEVSSPDFDTSPHLTADELELWLTSARTGSAMTDIYVAKRASTAVPFGTPQRDPVLSTAFDEDSLWISDDGLRIMFSSNAGSSIDLYSASRPDRGSSWSTPMIVSELSTPDGIEGAPTLSADELEIIFISNRDGGVGKYDLWTASRPSRSAAFSTPINLPQLSSPEDEWGPSLSRDGRTLYYSYNSTLAGGNAEIWVSTRSCL